MPGKAAARTAWRDNLLLARTVRVLAALKLPALNLDRRAVTAIEYALIASLIAVAIVTSVTNAGHSVSGVFTRVGNGL